MTPDAMDYRFAEPYRARPVSFLELWEHEAWRLKLYGIAYRSAHPSASLIEGAKRLAAGSLPQPACTDARYGVGFVGVHEGRGSNLVFVDWWEAENELHHQVFSSRAESPLDFIDETRTDRVGCVWDIGLIAFERRAWIDTVLLQPDRPDLEAYLRCRRNGVE